MAVRSRGAGDPRLGRDLHLQRLPKHDAQGPDPPLCQTADLDPDRPRGVPGGHRHRLPQARPSRLHPLRVHPGPPSARPGHRPRQPRCPALVRRGARRLPAVGSGQAGARPRALEVLRRRAALRLDPAGDRAWPDHPPWAPLDPEAAGPGHRDELYLHLRHNGPGRRAARESARPRRALHIHAVSVRLGARLDVAARLPARANPDILGPQDGPGRQGYHALQSRIAIGSGGLFGKGLDEATQSRLKFLPEGHTDFVFAVFAEQWGFIGVLMLFVLFVTLIFLASEIAWKAKDPLGLLLATGILSMVGFCLMVNVGMTMGIFPIVGIPLPLMSYGGATTLTPLAALGAFVDVKRRRCGPFL